MNRVMRSFVPQGAIRMQPSKSVLHRALICAALADGVSRLGNFARSDDIDATMGVLRALGIASFTTREDECTVHGSLGLLPEEMLDCRESGTTLRLLFPLALDGTKHILTGRGRLMQRPFGPYEELCRVQGIRLRRDAGGIIVHGRLSHGDIAFPGDVSSQFVSGLLLGYARQQGASRIVLTSPLESAPYVDLTRSVMRAFGAETERGSDFFAVRGPQQFRPRDMTVEGDYSHAAFFAAAGALAGSVTLAGLNRQSLQGDRAILDILSEAGADVTWSEDNVRVEKCTLRPFATDVSQIPDLVPVLAVLACGINGTSRLTNAARLRLKESDRLEAMTRELTKLGADVEELPDGLVIHGTGRLRGGAVESHNDHRVVMALCAAALVADGEVEINGTEAVKKSAPRFFEEWAAIGGA